MHESPNETSSIVIATAADADLDAIVEITWAGAAERRWLGVEVLFDRSVRRASSRARDPADDVLGFRVAHLTTYFVAELALAVAEHARDAASAGYSLRTPSPTRVRVVTDQPTSSPPRRVTGRR